MTKLRLLLGYILPFALGTGVFAYIIAKAYYVQITVDEAYTLTVLMKESVWNLVSYASSYTNNHILNTLLCKLSFSIFGMNQVAGRLPNILSFVLYFWYAWRFSRRFFTDDFVGFMFVAVMLGNPFMLEFFALARGYGMSFGLMMPSIYYAARYVLEDDKRSLPLSILFAILSVYAQFALLHFYLALNILIFSYDIHKYLKTQNKEALLRGVGTLFLGVIILGILVYAPFRAILKDNQISYYGSKNIWDDSIVSLIKRSLYGQGYFSDKTLTVFKNLMVAVFVVSIINFYKKIKNTKTNLIEINNTKIENNKLKIADNKNQLLNTDLVDNNKELLIQNNSLLIKNNELLISNNEILLSNNQSAIINNQSKKDPSVFSFILLLSIVFVITAQFYALGTQYVVDRTCLFLYPIIALSMTTVATFIGNRNVWARYFIVFVFSAFCMWHVYRSANLTYFAEWWFDTQTKAVIAEMKNEYQKMQVKRPIKLHTHWTFQPSFYYYYYEQHLDWLFEPFGWDNKVDTINKYDYYYDLNDEWDALKPHYDTLKVYDNGESLLLKHK